MTDEWKRYYGSIRLDELTYDKLREKLLEISSKYRFVEQQVHVVSARTLTSEESIGNPERRDFPLVKGREVMIEARFLDAVGQAFTDIPGDFRW